MPLVLVSKVHALALALRVVLRTLFGKLIIAIIINKLIVIYMYLIMNECLSKSNKNLVYYLSCQDVRCIVSRNFCCGHVLRGLGLGLGFGIYGLGLDLGLKGPGLGLEG